MVMHRLRSSLVLQLLLGTGGAALVSGTPACDSPCDDPWSTPEPYAVADLPTDRAVRGSGNNWIVGDGGLVAIIESAGATVLPPPVATDLHAVVVTTEVAILVGAGGTILTGTLDGSEFLRATLPSTADLWHVADIQRNAGNSVIAVGDDVMFIREALDGTWTAVTPPEGGWGRLRAVGQSGDEGLIAVGLGGVVWSAVQPAGPWRRLDLGTTADLTSFDSDAYQPLIGGSHSTLLTYAPDSGWSPLAHDFAGDVVDLAYGYILTSTGGIHEYDYYGLHSKPIATVGPGLNVLTVVGYAEQLLVFGDPGRAVSLDNACPPIGGCL